MKVRPDAVERTLHCLLLVSLFAMPGFAMGQGGTALDAPCGAAGIDENGHCSDKPKPHPRKE